MIAWGIDRCWTALNHLQVSTFRKRIVLWGYWLMMSLMFASYTFLTSQRNLDWKNSHSLWTATLKTNPDSPIALNSLGLLYAQQGMYEKAIALYEQLLKFHPNQEHVERVYANMAGAYFGRQMFDEAIDYYQKALEIDPKYIHAYTGLGRVHLESGQYDEAIRMFQWALEIDPSLFRIHVLLGDLCVRTHRTECATEAYQNALKLQPENKELLEKLHAVK